MTWTNTHNCGCHDPCVFGHHCPHTNWPTYRTGQTFTTISAAFHHITKYSNTTWNWAEVARTSPFTIELRETPENRNNPWN